MTEKNSGPREAVRGVVEDVMGKAKEAVGIMTGRDDLVREAKAQQDKAEYQRDAAKRQEGSGGREGPRPGQGGRTSPAGTPALRPRS